MTTMTLACTKSSTKRSRTIRQMYSHYYNKALQAHHITADRRSDLQQEPDYMKANAAEARLNAVLQKALQMGPS